VTLDEAETERPPLARAVALLACGHAVVPTGEHAPPSDQVPLNPTEIQHWVVRQSEFRRPR
jgi:hypothetical protein